MARLEQAEGSGGWQRRKSADDRRTNPVTGNDGCRGRRMKFPPAAVRVTREPQSASLASMRSGA